MNSDGDDIDDADYFHDCAEEEEYIFYDCNETASRVDHSKSLVSHWWGDSTAYIEGIGSRDFMKLLVAGPSSSTHQVSNMPKAGNDFSSIQHLSSYLINRHDVFYEDVCEVFGGAGETLRIVVKRKLKGGKNFNLTCKVDLLDKCLV